MLFDQSNGARSSFHRKTNSTNINTQPQLCVRPTGWCVFTCIFIEIHRPYICKYQIIGTVEIVIHSLYIGKWNILADFYGKMRKREPEHWLWAAFYIVVATVVRCSHLWWMNLHFKSIRWVFKDTKLFPIYFSFVILLFGINISLRRNEDKTDISRTFLNDIG